MTYVVYNPDTMKVYKKQTQDRMHYADEKTAKRMATRLKNERNLPDEKVKVATLEQFNTEDIEVPTTNILGDKGNVVMIRKSLKGSCCDPGTESYHCM